MGTTKGALLVAVATGAVVLGGSAASAAPYPPTPVSCSVDPSSAPPNSPVSLSCVGLQPGSAVQVTGSGSARATDATATAGPDGSFRVDEAVGDVGSGAFTLRGLDASGQPSTTVVDVEAVQTSARTRGGTVSDPTVEPGEPTTFSGSGCAPGTTVTYADDGTPMGSGTADPTGAFSTVVRLTTVGRHTLTATCLDPDGNTLVVTATVDVLGTAQERGGLPFTGADGIVALLAVGTGLVVAGGSFVVVGRHRSG